MLTFRWRLGGSCIVHCFGQARLMQRPYAVRDAIRELHVALPPEQHAEQHIATVPVARESHRQRDHLGIRCLGSSLSGSLAFGALSFFLLSLILQRRISLAKTAS